jgi:rhodanese-related sulfurtransferase
VLDVRQVHEWRTGRLPQAILREAGDLEGELDLPRDRALAVHCAHGERAATALSVLERRGFEHLALVIGGPDEWRAAGGAVERGEARAPA